jgi:RNA polymerase sigma-70 factor (ECF subfamily)
MESDSQPNNAAAAPALTLERIREEHLGFIQRYLASIGIDGADLEDVVQEVLLAVFRALKRFDPGRGALRPWLQAIAFHQAMNFQHRNRRHREPRCPEDELLVLSSDSPDPEQCAIDSDRRRVLDALLSEVAPPRRTVLVAYELEEHPMDEIAGQLAIPVASGHSRLRIARQELSEAARRWKARCRGCLLALGSGTTELSSDGERDAETWLSRLRDRSAHDAAPRPPRAPAEARATWRPKALHTAHTLLSIGVLGVFVAGHARRDGTSPAERRDAVSQVLAATEAAPGERLPAPIRHVPLSAAPAAEVQSRPARPARGQAEPQRAVAAAISTQHAERELIRHAAAAFAAGHHLEAASSLDRHAREFPAGIYAGTREELRARLPASFLRNTSM